MQLNIPGAIVAALCMCVLHPTAGNAADGRSATIQEVVAHAIRPVMARYGIPGMAVGIILNGQVYLYDYGVASKATGKPVASDTLFEIGSVSKTFTATLASYAQVSGRLSLSDTAGKYFPTLRGSSFDTVSLLELGTHTTGGFPLQLPDDIDNTDQLMSYFRNWKPTYAPGTYRTYANPSIGMFGLIAAKSMNEDFAALMESRLFPKLGLKNTYIDVPTNRMAAYAQGYTNKDVPIRVSFDGLGKEAYGVRINAGDLLRFVEANMGMLDLDPEWQRAITDTHTGYFRIGMMMQDLVWEQYRYPVDLKTLLDGNGDRMSRQANQAVRLDPPLPPQGDVLIDKTGSTNGFGAYVAFVPERKLGIVLLANKNYPIDARVTVALAILTQLDRVRR
ncbi:MAG: class C beta-lactamase [Janthinobacterium lividum]